MGKRFKSDVRNKQVRTKLYLKEKKEKLKVNRAEFFFNFLLFFIFKLRFFYHDQAKKKSKLENKDKPKQTPKTIENQRVRDETYIADGIENDQELQLDLRTDELSRHLNRRARGNNDDEDQTAEEFEKSQKAESGDESDVEVEEDSEGDDDDSSNDPKILITTTDMTISFKTYKLCRELSRVLPNAQYFYRKNVRLSKVIPEAIKRHYSAIIVINENHKEPSKFFIFCFV